MRDNEKANLRKNAQRIFLVIPESHPESAADWSRGVLILDDVTQSQTEL
jgi:hypothetical protein